MIFFYWVQTYLKKTKINICLHFLYNKIARLLILPVDYHILFLKHFRIKNIDNNQLHTFFCKEFCYVSTDILEALK